MKLKINYEKIKSLLLIFLVLLSIFLTWNIWTYQPTYNLIEEGTTVENVSIGTKNEMENVIFPSKMRYVVSDKQIYETINTKEIDHLMTELYKWDLTEITDVSFSVDNINRFMNQQNTVHLVFNTLIPMDVYKSVLNDKNGTIPSFNFDEIMIDFNTFNEDELGVVYFIYAKNKEVYQANIPASYLTGIQKKYLNNVSDNGYFAKVEFMETTDHRRLYYVDKPEKIYSYQHLFRSIESEKFKNALFKNPDLVQKNSIISGTEYTDGFSVLRIYDNFTLSYINPSEMIQTTSIITTEAIKRSLDYVNEHAGWNYNYHLVSNDVVNNKVEFRMIHEDGYPIFSDTPGLSTISLRWGNNGIVEYFRGNFTLGVEMEKFEMDILSGKQVVEYLSTQYDVSTDIIEEITIGYKMRREGSSVIVYLLPTWYYKVAGKWSEVPLDIQGRGMENGLE